MTSDNFYHIISIFVVGSFLSENEYPSALTKLPLFSSFDFSSCIVFSFKFFSSLSEYSFIVDELISLSIWFGTCTYLWYDTIIETSPSSVPMFKHYIFLFSLIEISTISG